MTSQCLEQFKWSACDKTDEFVTNDVKLTRNCDNVEENLKYNSEVPTATWPPLQYAKQLFWKVRLVTPTPPPPHYLESLSTKYLLIDCPLGKQGVQ